MLATRLSLEQLNNEEGIENALVDITKIGSNPVKLRPTETEGNKGKQFDELSANIGAIGIQYPPVVVLARLNDGTLIEGMYTLADGQQRTEAARKAGLTKIPVRINHNVKTETDLCALQLALNVHRIDTDGKQYRDHILKMTLEDPTLTANDVVALTGKSITWVGNILNMKKLSDPVKAMCDNGDLTVTAGQFIAKLPEDHQMDWAEKYINTKTDPEGRVVGWQEELTAELQRIRSEKSAGKDVTKLEGPQPKARTTTEILEAYKDFIEHDRFADQTVRQVFEWFVKLDPVSIHEYTASADEKKAKQEETKLKKKLADASNDAARYAKLVADREARDAKLLSVEV